MEPAEMMPGVAEIRKCYMCGSGKPGLGIDTDETLAAKYPMQPDPTGDPYRLERAADGSVVRP